MLRGPAVSLEALPKMLPRSHINRSMSAFFVSTGVFLSYTFNLVQLHHSLLLLWTASTPASTAGDITRDKL